MASHLSATFSSAGCFADGSLAGVEKLPRCGLAVAAGAPLPRHGKKMVPFPAGFLACKSKGAPAPLLVVMAAGTAAPGESYFHDPPSATFKGALGGVQLTRYVPPSSAMSKGAFAGVQLTRYAPPSSAKSKAVGFLAPKGGRLAVVVAAAPGESDDGLAPVDCEVAVSIFRMEMETFKLSQRPVAFVGSMDDPLLDAASSTAKDCSRMVDFLLAKEPIRRDVLKEIILAGQSFLIVESQTKELYVKADALVNAIQGIKLVGKTFFKDANLPEYSAPTVPLSIDDVDRDSFFKELVDLYIVYYTVVYWEAWRKHGFWKAGTN